MKNCISQVKFQWNLAHMEKIIDSSKEGRTDRFGPTQSSILICMGE